METKDHVDYWIELSDYDIETANAMLTTKRLLYVGFMCHQAVEKLLKAYYVSKKRDNPPYTHNLSYLAKQAELYESLTEEQKDFLDLLEPLNIEARYPTHKERLLKSLSVERCQTMLANTRELLAWIKKQL